MKRNLITLIAIILVLAMAAGCAKPAKLSRGAITADIFYTNESAGLTFTIPDGWQYLSEDEIAQILGEAAQPESSGEVPEGQVVYDMTAVEPATGARVMVIFQNFAISGADMDEEAYFDDFKKSMRVSSPYDVEFSHYTDTEISGNSYKTMAVTFTADGAKQYYYIRSKGVYMICILVSVPNSGYIDPVMACFS